MSWKYPLSDIDITESDLEALMEVARSKWFSLGPKTSELESSFAQYCGVKHALGVSSGTAALHLALMAMGVEPGDEVIVPSLTFAATSNVVLYCGATPVFVDILGPEDLNMDPNEVARHITPKTKGVILVHYGGYPVDMDGLESVLDREKHFIVEDAAHAPGATANGKKAGKRAGSLGDIGCFSLFANKNIAVGEGGLLTTDDPDIAETVRLLRCHGMSSQTWDRHSGRGFTYDIVNLGHNYRINEMESVLALGQLDRLDANNAKRKELTLRYWSNLEGLANIDILSLPFRDRPDGGSFHILPILLKDPEVRVPLLEHLKERGIQTSIHYRPVHLMSYYRESHGHQVGELPKTEDVAGREVTLPLHSLMSEADVDQICTAVKDFFA